MEALRTFEGRALGSPLRLTVAGGSEPAARAAWEQVRSEFDAVDATLSRFRDDSELTALNRAAGRGTVVVGSRLRAALILMDRARRVTGGRFDARVLADLERLGEHGASLGQPAIRQHRPSGPVVRIACDGAVAIDEPVDSGGLGKGLALRWAARNASRAIRGLNLLLEAGGDIVAGGRAPDGGWLIGIEDPRAAGESPVAVARLDVGAIATSSIRVRQWRDDSGRSVHHLIDPGTGEPADGSLVSVTVSGSDPAWAEIHAKSLFIAGPKRIGDAARSLGLAAWWVDAAGCVEMTPAARLRSVWVSD